MHLQATPRHNTWLGLSFERLCFAHIYEIQKALGITGVATKTYALLTDSAQMEMVIVGSRGQALLFGVFPS